MLATVITGINEATVRVIFFFSVFRHVAIIFYNDRGHLISYGWSHTGHGPFCSKVAQILTAGKLRTETMGKLSKPTLALIVVFTPEGA